MCALAVDMPNHLPDRIKTCAVVQGNIRRGTEEALLCLARQFDLVILSTWDDEPLEKIPVGKWELVCSTKPVVSGLTHRNFQRLSTAAGLRRAAELGATHVLKWRTDMLPTKLDVGQLLAWSNFDVPTGMTSRLVTCAFRNLTVRQDWFSTMPDLFAFGDLGLMQLLWGDAAFDYGLDMNVPSDMAEETGVEWQDRLDAAGIYCPEAELYAIFKSRLQRFLGIQFTHARMAKGYMRLIDHQRLGICWFRQDEGFRSISQALQHPWWTEDVWKSGSPQVTEWGYPESGWMKKYRGKWLTPRIIASELKAQTDWYEKWVNQMQHQAQT